MNSGQLARIGLTLAILTACSGPETAESDFERMIQEEVQQRLDRWESIRLARCREALYLEASARVDSIILEEARRMASDKDKPRKPGKPRRPDPIELPDTFTLEPIFRRDTIEGDTSGG